MKSHGRSSRPARGKRLRLTCSTCGATGQHTSKALAWATGWDILPDGRAFCPHCPAARAALQQLPPAKQTLCYLCGTKLSAHRYWLHSSNAWICPACHAGPRVPTSRSVRERLATESKRL